MITYQVNNTATLGATPTLRVGLFVDGLDGSRFTGGEYTLEHLRGTGFPVIGTATHSFTPNATIDGLFWDVSGLQDNDRIRFSTIAGSGPGQFAAFQGVSFDTVPEPSRAVLMALGLGAMGAVRRRRE